MGYFRCLDFRKEYDLLQSDMAAIIGSGQSLISRIENEGLDLSKSQYLKLYEKFGKEKVDVFKVENSPSHNYNYGGTQNNGFQIKETPELIALLSKQSDIIREQMDAQKIVIDKLSAQTDRFLEVLEKLATK